MILERVNGQWFQVYVEQVGQGCPIIEKVGDRHPTMGDMVAIRVHLPTDSLGGEIIWARPIEGVILVGKAHEIVDELRDALRGVENQVASDLLQWERVDL
jgi:hypothetical protein